MANYNRSMKTAPKETILLLVIPTADPEEPEVELGWWDKELKRWEGDWRYYKGEDGYPDAEPYGWAHVPDVDISRAEPISARKAKNPVGHS